MLVIFEAAYSNTISPPPTAALSRELTDAFRNASARDKLGEEREMFMAVTRRSTLLALGIVAVNPAGAQPTAWSDRPIRLIAGFAPGGPTDVVARILADHLGHRWPVPVVVENRVGAGGNIASQFVARSRPDGSMALVATTSFAVNPAVSSRAGYRLDEFAPAAIDRGGHDGDGEGHRASDRQPPLREGAPLLQGQGAGAL